MREKMLLVAAAMTAMWVFGSFAGATPYFTIDDLPDWSAAQASGKIVPVDAGVFGEMMDDPIIEGDGWPDDYKYETVFCTPELYVMEHSDSSGKSEPGLVMKWGDPDGQNDLNQRYAAAWDYVYPLDPDLSGTILEFSIHAPEQCWYVSVNLIDKDGDYREWIWHVGDAGEIPACTWTTVKINPVTGWSNYVPLHLFTAAANPNGVFDLNQITKIRFDENGRWSTWLSNNDENGPNPNNILLWNAWDHVTVEEVPVPEPAGLGLIGVALLALRRRRA